MVDAVDDGQVGALGRSRDQDPFRAGGRDACSALVAVGEEAGAFERQVDSIVAVRKLARIALGGDQDPPAVDDQVVAVMADLARIGAVDRIPLEQQGVGFGVGEIVDRDQLEAAVLALEDRPRHQAADPPETVDRNSRRHVIVSFELSAARIRGTIASAVKPKRLKRSSAGAEAPNRSMPMASPSGADIAFPAHRRAGLDRHLESVGAAAGRRARPRPGRRTATSRASRRRRRRSPALQAPRRSRPRPRPRSRWRSGRPGAAPAAARSR